MQPITSLHDLGQPLHTFDADKMGAQPFSRYADIGTQFLALDGRAFTLKGKELMICDASGRGMCIGGVYGGKTPV